MLITSEEKQVGWFTDLCNKVLTKGPIPRHMGIIMDGNRRFARNLNIDTSLGHKHGMTSLFNTLFWCRNLGITNVTVYAFSLDNFKRSKQEVDYLMELAYEKFSQLLTKTEKIDEYGIKIRFIGRLELLPLRLQNTLARVILATKHHNKCFLNICISYTARDEITTAISEIAQSKKRGDLLTSDIDYELITSSLQLDLEVDLLIRTSGEVRLSDFLLWQSSFSILAFLDVLWPDFQSHHLHLAIIFYQQNIDSIQKAKKITKEYYSKLRDSELIELYGKENLEKSVEEKNKRTQIFLKQLKDRRDLNVNNLLNKISE